MSKHLRWKRHSTHINYWVWHGIWTTGYDTASETGWMHVGNFALIQSHHAPRLSCGLSCWYKCSVETYELVITYVWIVLLIQVKAVLARYRWSHILPQFQAPLPFSPYPCPCCLRSARERLRSFRGAVQKELPSCAHLIACVETLKPLALPYHAFYLITSTCAPTTGGKKRKE